MKALKIVQAVLLALILLAGAVALVLWARTLFRYPHLHLALSKVRLSTVLFCALVLISAALAVVAAEYVLFNLRGRLLELLAFTAAYLLLLAGCGYCFRRAVMPLPYTDTEAIADYEKDFAPEHFSASKQVFPQEITGTVTGYRWFKDGDLEAELVNITYELPPYYTETARLRALRLPYFKHELITCYELQEGEVLYQIWVNAETHQIQYCRYINPERLPSYAPQPMKPDPERGLRARVLPLTA